MRGLFAYVVISYKRQLSKRHDATIATISMIIAIYVQHYVWNYCFVRQRSQAIYMFKYIIVSYFIGLILENDIALDISEIVHRGEIGNYLLRPINPMLLLMAKDMGEVVRRLFTEGLLLVILYFISFGLDNFNFVLIIKFLSLLVLLYLFSAMLYINVGCLAFVFNSVRPFNTCLGYVIRILGGSLFPLDFFPTGMREIFYKLPFQYFYDYPIRFLLDNKNSYSDSYAKILLIVGISVMVTVGLFAIIYTFSIKKVEVFGG